MFFTVGGRDDEIDRPADCLFGAIAEQSLAIVAPQADRAFAIDQNLRGMKWGNLRGIDGQPYPTGFGIETGLWLPAQRRPSLHFTS